MDSGIAFAAGYAGSPATAVMDAVIGSTAPVDVYAEWSANEKVAVESALGASMAGARSLVVLKSVGMNACVDPLMVANLTGIRAGMVILLGDDPGAGQSQNDQDSRSLAVYEELPLIEPCTVADGYRAVRFAFELSEELCLPVVVRFTLAFAQLEGDVERTPAPVKPKRVTSAVRHDVRWISTTHNVLENHQRLHERLDMAERRFAKCNLNGLEGDGEIGVVAAGAAYALLQDVLAKAGSRDVRVLKLATIFPLPRNTIREAVEGLDQVLVLEDNEPVVEERIRAMGFGARVRGRLTGNVPREGDLLRFDVAQALHRLTGDSQFENAAQSLESDRPTPSLKGFCDECPYVPAFEAFQAAVNYAGLADRVMVAGDPGCMVKGVYPPYELFDIKLCMGSSIAAIAGAVRANPHLVGVAFTGDASLFHTGVNALLHAASARTSMLIVIVDNQATALTGCQPHPGTPLDARGMPKQPIEIEDLVRLCNPDYTAVIDPTRYHQIRFTFARALDRTGLRVIVVRRPCPLIAGSQKEE